MTFEKIKQSLPDNRPLSLLKVLEQNGITNYDELLIFKNADQPFREAVRFLASPETIAAADLTQWSAVDCHVIAQTIDGDYLAGTESVTFVIPSSLYKSDIERYDLPLIDFLIQYTSGQLSSKILPQIV